MAEPTTENGPTSQLMTALFAVVTAVEEGKITDGAVEQRHIVGAAETTIRIEVRREEYEAVTVEDGS